MASNSEKAKPAGEVETPPKKTKTMFGEAVIKPTKPVPVPDVINVTHEDISI